MSNSIPVQGIDHINMAVADLSRAIAFYQSVFGFDLREDGRDRDSGPYVILGHGQAAFLALHEYAETAVPDRPFIGHWGFTVGSLEPVLERLQELDIPLVWPRDEPGVVEYPRSRSVYIEDPDGHQIELSEVFGGGL